MVHKVCLKGGAVVDVISDYHYKNEHHYIFHNSAEENKPETEKGSLIPNGKAIAVFKVKEIVGIIGCREK